MSDKKIIELDVKTNAEQVGNQFGKLADNAEKVNKAEQKVNKTNKDLHATFEDVYGEVKPLTTQMGEMEDRLYEMALAGEQTTDEFKNLLAEVGKYRKTQIETDLAVDTAAQTMSAKLGGALQGAASGFAVVQGAMGLFGTESEEVEEALLKVNSAMALAQGIAGVQEFSKSFGLASKATKAFTLVQKGLNLVLKANPFALIVTAVIGLIGYFAVFTDAINVVIDSLKSVSDFLGITDSEAEEAASKRKREAEVQKQLQEQEQARQEQLHNSRMSALDREIAVAKANGKDTTKLQKQKINEEIALRKAAMATLLVEQEKLKVFKDQFTAMASQGGLRGKLGQAGLAAIAESESNVLELQEEILNLENELVILDIEFEKRKETKNTQSKSDADKKADEDAKELKRQKEIEKQRQANLKKLRDDFETSLEAETEIANKRLIGEQEFEKNLVRDKYFNLIEQAKKYGLDTQVLEENQQAAIQAIEKKYEQEAADRKKETDKQEKADRDDKINAIAERYDKQFQLANDALGAISDLVSTFAGESEEAQKKAFKINKAISIGQAIISTAQGIMAQLAVPQDALTGANFVKAGIVALTGVAQVAKISQTKFKSSGGSVGNITTPSGGGSGSGTAPQPNFNVVGDSGINQLAQLQMQPTQAFVVSGDITTAQSLDRNKIENATL
jgi:hypothetical protein